VDLCKKAEDMGYSSDLCSYARGDIACATVNGGPIGGLPAPDMLVCCNNICGTVLKWYEVQARYFKVPLFIFDTPIVHTEFTREMKTYVQRQMEEYIVFLENVTGRKMDRDRMAEVGKLSFEGQQLWQEVLDTTMNRPSPMTAFDAFFYLALIVTLRGTKQAVDFYRGLRDEMRLRASAGQGAIPREKYRLLWDNLPIWYRLKWLSQEFAKHDASLVADTYTSAWCGSMKYIDQNDFIGSAAETYTRIYLNIGVDKMAEIVLSMIDKYQADGIVMHSNRSCKPYSFGQYDIQKIVQRERGIPSLMIEADMCDERSFSEAQIQTRIDAFMEMIRAGKGAS
ncbi:MAG TPA: 2-hydroxyacyl-CoA dehydratase family protein, partial [Smithella sp.]|nr:2-hydroxyacyl-CoA dehydratase family protein [Smithella sp.]